MAAAMGAIAQFGIGATSTVDTKYELVSGDMGIREDPFHDSSGLLGSRLGATSERVVANTMRPGTTSSLVLEPNSVELDVWLPHILGTAESSDVFALAETLTAFYISLDKVTKVELYNNCVVSKATFQSSQGQPMQMVLDVEALTVTVGNSGTFPSLSLNVALGPYMHSDVAFSLGGSAYKFRSWKVEIDNVLDTERFFNSTTRQSLPTKDCIITWTFDGPYGDNVALYGTAVTGIAVSATYTIGNRSVIFSSPKVSFPRQSSVLNGKEEIMLPLTGIARKSGSTAKFSVTNDSTA